MNTSPDITFKVETGMPITDSRKGRLTKRIGGAIIDMAEEMVVGQSFQILHDRYARESVRARISQLNTRLEGTKHFLCRKTEDGIRVHRIE